MTDTLAPEERPSTPDAKTDERVKVAARCRECGAVYSARVRSDDSIQPIGRKDGCRCGADDFRAISKTTTPDSSSSKGDGDW